jgi:hypothetical protein
MPAVRRQDTFMTHQPVPAVSRQDVIRIVRRDFPNIPEAEVLAILDEYGADRWHRERDRVQLAVLKLAAGDSQALLSQLSTALKDYRDVLAYAEYPTDIMNGWDYKYKPGEHERIYEEDWNQYQQWLTRK